MKRIISTLLLCLMLCGTVLPMTSCSDADQSGEWGAYYQAFRAFSQSVPSGVDSVCLNYDGIEEENQKKLYDLFFEYCDDRSKRIYTGNVFTLMEIGRLDMVSNLFKNACAVSFGNIRWNEERTEVTLTVSICYGLFADAGNDGGLVTVSKTEDGWKASVTVDEKTLMKTDVGAYATVLQYYLRPEIQIDPINNRYIALDPEHIDAELLPQLRNYMQSLFGKQGMSYLEASWQGLLDNGYIDGSRFTEGYHISFGELQWSDDKQQVVINSWMTKADLEALGGIFSLSRTEDGWEIVDVQEMVS